MNETLNYKLNPEMVASAIAMCYHFGQKDKGGNEYYEHCRRVAEASSNTDERVVGYLHDVLEDTKCDIEYLKHCNVDGYIIDAIIAMTRNENEKYFDYIDRLKKNPIARKVKINDVIDNMDLRRLNRELTIDDISLYNKRYLKTLKILRE